MRLILPNFQHMWYNPRTVTGKEGSIQYTPEEIKSLTKKREIEDAYMKRGGAFIIEIGRLSVERGHIRQARGEIKQAV